VKAMGLRPLARGRVRALWRIGVPRFQSFAGATDLWPFDHALRVSIALWKARPLALS
jgi:hypothetical protein